MSIHSIVVSIGCFTLGSFGKDLKRLKLTDLIVQAISIDWFALSIDSFFENIIELVKSVKTVFVYFKSVLASDW